MAKVFTTKDLNPVENEVTSVAKDAQVEKEITEKPEKHVKTEKPKALKVYKITFHGEGGNIEIGHNYKLNSYPRNIETTIDENYLGVLKASVIHTTTQDAEGNNKDVKFPSYSYTLEQA